LVVNSEARNTRVVAILIVSMTLGAAALLWLEPPTPGWSSSTLLMAETVRGLEEVRIDFTGLGDGLNTGDYDCVVKPDGECEWRPRGSHISMLVVGSDDDAMPATQARTLLAVLGSMSQRHGLDLGGVWLHPLSDARLHPELPRSAHDLCDLLVRKGIIP
jgi:hypothetical protein